MIFEKKALPLQREHEISLLLNEKIIKIRLQIAPEMSCNLISRFYLILHRKHDQNYSKITPKSVENPLNKLSKII